MAARRSFMSDNASGVHPRIMAAIAAANDGHAVSYGDDEYTARAVDVLRGAFGAERDVYLVWGGTAANVLGLKAVTRPYHGIICPETAHINVHECGAPEHFTGCKLLTVKTPDGKLRPEQCRRFIEAIGDTHAVQPRVISISQPTERGTVYSVEEVSAIARFAHENGMVLHMDGARLANAAVSLGNTLRGISFDAGVDALSFGGTKCGLMFGEAVLFADMSHADEFCFIRKQGMQLYSKMRFAAAQFEALLADGLIYDIARRANEMASRFAALLEVIPGITITQPVQANAVFAVIPHHAVETLDRSYGFHVIDTERSECRLMISWDTDDGDIEGFAALARSALAQ